MADEGIEVRLALLEAGSKQRDIKLEEMRQMMVLQSTDTKELLDAWKSSRSVVAFVYFVAKLVAAVAAAWVVLKGFTGLQK